MAAGILLNALRIVAGSVISNRNVRVHVKQVTSQGTSKETNRPLQQLIILSVGSSLKATVALPQWQAVAAASDIC